MGGMPVIKKRIFIYINQLIVLFLFFLFSACIANAITKQQYVDNLVAKALELSSQEGKSLLSINYINKAIKLQPRSLKIYYKRAFVYGRAGLYVEAIKDLNLILNSPSRSQFPAALKFRAECLAMLGDYRSALADYLTLLERAPKSGKIWYYYAELLWFVGEKDKALIAISNGLKIGSHWGVKMKRLQSVIWEGKKIKLHEPFSN